MNEKVRHISSQLCDYLRNNVLADDVQFNAETPFAELGIDSYSIIELVLFIERRFGVEIREEDLVPDNLYSVASLAQCATKVLEVKS